MRSIRLQPASFHQVPVISPTNCAKIASHLMTSSCSGTFIQLAENIAFGSIDKVAILSQSALRLKSARVMQRLEYCCENTFL
jgi:hypothetical protein